MISFRVFVPLVYFATAACGGLTRPPSSLIEELSNPWPSSSPIEEILNPWPSPSPIEELSNPWLSPSPIEELSYPWPNIPPRIGRIPTTPDTEPPLDISTLQYVYMVTRHGSRSPLATYPTDPYPYYDLKYWPDGSGQLTKVGKQQLYEAGKNYRARYNGFISEEYNVNETLVRSNLFDRDYMSAACLLAGFYPPVGRQVWNPYILWQPIPIWEEPFDLAEIRDKCPRYMVETTKALSSLSRRLLSTNSNLFSYLSKNMKTNVTSVVQVFFLWDCLTMQTENCHKIPKWTKSLYPDKLAPIVAEFFYTLAGSSSDVMKLTGGPVLRNVSSQLTAKASGEMKPAERKLFIEAAHDITIQALVTGLGFTERMIIDTSASISFELHKDKSAGHLVQVLYFNNSATRVPHLMKVPSCGKYGLCTLTEFNSIVSKIDPGDWNQACQL